MEILLCLGRVGRGMFRRKEGQWGQSFVLTACKLASKWSVFETMPRVVLQGLLFFFFAVLLCHDSFVHDDYSDAAIN